MLRGECPPLVLCCDAPASEDGDDDVRTFRHELYAPYKAHRPPLPLDLIPQFDLIKRAAQAYGLVQVQAAAAAGSTGGGKKKPGFEADDVLATLATRASRREGRHVQILSGDKDLLQLVTEGAAGGDCESGGYGPIEMMDPITGVTWTHDAVVERWGVPPGQLGDVLALAGDASDNVPGVPGIGPKIAAQLLQEYGSLRTVLDMTDTVKQAGRRRNLETYRDQALLSRELVELKRDLEWSDMQLLHPNDQEFAPPAAAADDLKVADLRMQPMDANRILRFYDEMNFHSIKRLVLEKLSRQTLIRYGPDADSMATQDDPPNKTSKRTWYAKKKMGIPKPEDYKDVPF
jgi:5'-3' exonuclease